MAENEGLIRLLRKLTLRAPSLRFGVPIGYLPIGRTGVLILIPLSAKIKKGGFQYLGGCLYLQLVELQAHQWFHQARWAVTVELAGTGDFSGMRAGTAGLRRSERCQMGRFGARSCNLVHIFMTPSGESKTGREVRTVFLSPKSIA